MRHARPDDLGPLSDLLVALRAFDGLKERTPGSFYRHGSGFLHFHVDGHRLFADVRVDGDWERLPVSTASERGRLLRAVRQVVEGRAVH